MKPNKIYRTICGVAMAVTGLFYAIQIVNAVNFKTFEDYGIQETFSAKSSVSGSTFAVVGIPLSYAVLSKGGQTVYTVHFTTGVSSSQTFQDHPSSSVYAIDGQGVNDTFRGIVYNPYVLIESQDANTTFYISISYFKPRGNGL